MSSFGFLFVPANFWSLLLGKKPTFHHLRTQMNKMKVNPVMVGNSDWRFLLGDGYWVPLMHEEEWGIHEKDFHLFDETEGTVRNPHCLCVTGNWNTAHKSPIV